MMPVRIDQYCDWLLDGDCAYRCAWQSVVPACQDGKAVKGA